VSTLHVTNGDSAAGTLRTFLRDPVLVTCDVLHDGPAPLVDDDRWYDTRARFLSEGFDARYLETRAALAAFDRTIAEARRTGEVVLWFEHDLFDQLLLIRTLDVLRGPERPALHGDGGADNVAPPFQGRDGFVSLICIGEFPGVDRFVGLGQLNAGQLASLYPKRERVTDEQFALARAAWRAFRSDDPRAFADVMRGDTRALPFLAGAIQRLFEEYPSTANGLSRTGHAILRALSAGPLDAGDLFCATQREEPRPFLGDWGFFDMVRVLANGRHSLVAIAPERSSVDLRGSIVSITDSGRDVLEGRRDAIVLNGIDEWRGGVHLEGDHNSPWRWDAYAKTLVS
jgi:hypothetical protein